jgi:hypothetical protein
VRIARSADGAIVVLTVEALFAAVESVVPAGAPTVAVFAIAPVVVAVPVTVIVTELPAPALSCTAVSEIALPAPEAPVPPEPVLQSAVPAATHVNVTPVRFAGTGSATVTPVTLDRPAFGLVTVTV